MHNVVKENVPGLTQEKVNKLACHKARLIKLTKKVPIKEKRKILVQEGGGFLPFLLLLVAPLIAKAVSKTALVMDLMRKVYLTQQEMLKFMKEK